MKKRSVSISEFCDQTERTILIMELIKMEMLERCYMYMETLLEHIKTAKTV